MTISSRLALLTMAGLLFSGQTMTANAADRGGGCCADLEERVAELEATTARKGNRVVSLQVYGQVNKALLFFDDGVDSDVFVVDPDSSGNRFGLKGAAKIQPGLSAGYNIELDVQDSASDKVTQTNDEGVENEILIRHNYIYIESETFGRLALGHTSAATDDANEVNLSGAIRNSNIHIGNNLFIQGSGGNLQLKHLAANFDAARDDVVRYDTPSIFSRTDVATESEARAANAAVAVSGLHHTRSVRAFRISGGTPTGGLYHLVATGLTAIGGFGRDGGFNFVSGLPLGGCEKRRRPFRSLGFSRSLQLGSRRFGLLHSGLLCRDLGRPGIGASATFRHLQPEDRGEVAASDHALGGRWRLRLGEPFTRPRNEFCMIHAAKGKQQLGVRIEPGANTIKHGGDMFAHACPIRAVA
jgi:hypothetical protein